MSPETQTTIEALWAYAAVFGTVVVGLSGWVGKIVAERIAQKERARIERESHAQQDALNRRRDVYADLATAMRVFMISTRTASADQKDAFLSAYDLAYLWASEEVAAALDDFVGFIQENTAKSGSVPQEKLQELYATCLKRMRQDSGFANTPTRYRVVDFNP